MFFRDGCMHSGKQLLFGVTETRCRTLGFGRMIK